MASSISASYNPAAAVSRHSAFCGKPMAPRFIQPARSASRNAPIVSMPAASPPYDLNKFSFEPIKESIVSREMTRRYLTDVITYADTDVIVVGAGSAGLSCAYELSKNPNVQVAIIEQSVSPGGGAWLGGQLFSPMVVRKPAHRFLDQLEVEYDEQEHYVVIKHAALFTSMIPGHGCWPLYRVSDTDKYADTAGYGLDTHIQVSDTVNVSLTAQKRC